MVSESLPTQEIQTNIAPNESNTLPPIESQGVDERDEINERVLQAGRETMNFIITKEKDSDVILDDEKAKIHEVWGDFEDKSTNSPSEVSPADAPIPERREALKNKPMIIRGHHLGLYENLMNAADATEKARFIKEYIENDRVEGLKAPSVTGNDYKVAYANDVIGPPERGEQFQQYVEQLLQKFVALPDDAPIDITEGIKDNLCFGCALGAHCSKKLVNGDPNSSILAQDQQAVAQLLQKISELQQNPQEPLAKITWETITFSDTRETEKVRRVTVPASVVKKVLTINKVPFPSNDTHIMS